MNSRRMIFVIGSALSAIGFMVLLFSTLSSASAAQPHTTADIENVADRWRILADIQFGLGSPGVVALNNKVHVISGFYTPGATNSSTQAVYDPLTNTWQYLWNIFPEPRSNMVTANIGDKVYAIGGWYDDLLTVISYTHMYDPVFIEWFTMTSMITPVSGAGGVVISDSIYIIGGFDGITLTKDVQIYNTISDTWSMGTPLPMGRSELEAVFLGGLIYAIGGNRADGDANPSTDAVEIYDPVLDSWSSGPPLPESRASMAVEVRSGKIYVIGGTDNWSVGTAVNTTYIFDPVLNAWSVGPPMPTARSATDAAVISDTIYVIGGVGGPGAGTANEAFSDFPILPSFTSIVSDDPDPSQSSQPLVVSYVVTSQLDIPTGVVTVTNNLNTQQCNQPLVNGSGQCEFTFVTPGVYSITATYGGDSFHTGSSDSASHTVIKAGTVTTIFEDKPDPSLSGKTITITFGVTSTYSIPNGMVTVTVNDNPQTCSSALNDGKGSCVLFFDTPDTYTLTATYSGDEFHNMSNVSESHQVIKADTFTTIIGDIPDPSLIGQPISITFGVTSTYGIPSGTVTVTVSDSPESCSTALIAGQGGCEITLDTQGIYTISASYGGDITYASSSDSTLHSVLEFLDLFIPIILRGQ